MGRNATPLKPAIFSPMLHEECPSRISRLRFCILASAFLTSLAILAVTTSSSGGKLNNLEVLQTQLREYGGLAKERRALEQKRAFLNNMIAQGISDSDYASASQQLHRALESKVRLLAKFEEESNQTPRSGYLQDHELSQKASNPEGEDDGWHMHEIGYSDVDGEAQHAPVLNEHTPPPPLQQIETPEGSLEKKHLLLDNFLEDAAFKLGPEESPRYHAPETAHLSEQIADINKLAKEQGVLLPPLSPESNVIFGKHGIFAARIEGKAINLLNGKPVEGVSIELVGPSDPLPPDMIEEVASDGPLHPEVSRVLRNLARGFAVIGLKDAGKSRESTVGAYETDSDDNGNFKLVAAPGIYSILGNAEEFDPTSSAQKMCTPDHITHVRVLLNPHLHRGHTRIVLTWGDRWWNREAKIAQLELVVQTPAGCLIRLGNPEVEIEPELGPELDKVCVEELKGREKSLASDVFHGGPTTIELENLSHGRYWVTVLERSSEAGGMDVTKMAFPECGKIFEATDAEVSVFTNDAGQQRFVVNKDGDLYGKGRCTWDVVGLDGATNELHRIYPEDHDQKSSLQNDPYAKFAVDVHGNKIFV